MQVIWTDPALERVAETAVHIARDDPAAAELWTLELFAAVERLIDFPESGRMVAARAPAEERAGVAERHEERLVAFALGRDGQRLATNVYPGRLTSSPSSYRCHLVGTTHVGQDARCWPTVCIRGIFTSGGARCENIPSGR